MDVSLFFNLLFDLIFIALPMDWNQLLSAHRYHPGSTTSLFHSHDRSQFQRDYDRLIFSSPFRRLQNKTQVFPLPGNIFVHNRLTHSLEVASVGRSLGNKVSQFLKQQQVEIENPEILEEMAEESPVGRNGTPMDIAKAMEYLSEATFVTGEVISVNGGYVI